MLVFVSSDRCIPMTIQYPKQFDLEFKTDVAQFIQKKRAAFRRRQKAALIPAGSCKRPFLYPKIHFPAVFRIWLRSLR